MKTKEKKIIMILVSIVLILGITYLITKGNNTKNVNNNIEEIKEESQNIEEFVKIQEDGTKVNISSKLQEEKELEGLKIGDIRITEKEGQFLLLAKVRNTTNSDIEPFYINIELLNEKGDKIATVTGAISAIKAGNKAILSAAVTEDYANAYDFKVTRK